MKKLLFLLAGIILLTLLLTVHLWCENGSNLKNIRTSFNGIKTRIVLEFDINPAFEIIEDWIDHCIEIKLSGTSVSLFKKSSQIPIRNHVVDRIEINEANETFILAKIFTKKNFTLEKLEFQNPSRLVFDVYMLTKDNTPYFYYNRGAIYELRGDEEKAVDQFKKALDVSPSFEKANYRLGTIFYAREDYDTAEKYLNRIRSGSYENKLAQQLLEAISNQALTADFKQEQSIHESDYESPENSQESIDSDLERINKKLEKLAEIISDESAHEKKDNILMQKIPGKSEVKFYDLKSKLKNPLNLLYIICFSLFTIIIVLFRRFIKILKTPQKKHKQVIQKATAIRKTIKKREKTNVSSPSAEFAKNLNAFYSRTNINTDNYNKKVNKPNTLAIKEESKFLSSEPGEAVKLIKTFKRENTSAGLSKETLSAIYELSDKNWYPWEIAKELNIGTEEVKMALNLKQKKTDVVGSSIRGRVNELYHSNLKARDIARELSIGEEEVKLSLKLLGKEEKEFETVN